MSTNDPIDESKLRGLRRAALWPMQNTATPCPNCKAVDGEQWSALFDLDTGNIKAWCKRCAFTVTVEQSPTGSTPAA